MFCNKIKCTLIVNAVLSDTWMYIYGYTTDFFLFWYNISNITWSMYISVWDSNISLSISTYATLYVGIGGWCGDWWWSKLCTCVGGVCVQKDACLLVMCNYEGVSWLYGKIYFAYVKCGWYFINGLNLYVGIRAFSFKLLCIA